ncbi:MAG: ribosome maturation factor RimP [Alphaproteobacteria bacterium]
MKLTPLESRIAQVISPVVSDRGLRLVSVRIIGEGGGRNIQVMAEDPVTRNMGVEECTALSHAVSVALDVENFIEGAYRLEVSSPGIDRLLITLQDYKDYIGFEAKIETDMPNENGQKRFRGFVEGIEDDTIILKTDTGRTEIPYGAITKSKLVLTDQLIKATAKNNTHQKESNGA